MVKAILFDLDGTIIDSETIAFRAIVDSCATWGIKVAPEVAALVAGKKWDHAFDMLQAKYKIPVSRQEMMRVILDRYHDSLQHELVVVPGVVEAIKRLAPHFQLALVSGSLRRDILYALAAIGVKEHFSVILGAEDYAQSKPAPDGYLLAMKMLKVEPQESIVFEDSFAGISSGIAAGAKVVAVTSTNHFKQDLQAAHASIGDFLKVDAEWVRGLG